MARGTRLDVPGALHHVMQRGHERGKIFRDAADYTRFLTYVNQALTTSITRCLAWALMPNHIHFLLQTGATPIARVLQPLFTRYAVTFNLRWHRSGHVFQGRYKSLLCEQEPYRLALVRYIHLNPIRAGLCEDLPSLAAYPWTGHRALMGKATVTWQDTAAVLDEFGSKRSEARAAYERFCRDGLREGPDHRLEGEGLRPLESGGWESVRLGRGEEGEWADQRILGGARFVENALEKADEHERWRSRVRRHGMSMERVLALVAAKTGVRVRDLTGSGKRPPQVRARALACHWLVGRMGYPGVLVARRLGITPAAVSKSAVRGARLPVGLRRQ